MTKVYCYSLTVWYRSSQGALEASQMSSYYQKYNLLDGLLPTCMFVMKQRLIITTKTITQRAQSNS